MSAAATIESPTKSSTTNLRYHNNGIDSESTTAHSNGNGVTAVVVTNPLASSSFSSTTSRYQSSVMNKYKKFSYTRFNTSINKSQTNDSCVNKY